MSDDALRAYKAAQILTRGPSFYPQLCVAQPDVICLHCRLGLEAHVEMTGIDGRGQHVTRLLGQDGHSFVAMKRPALPPAKVEDEMTVVQRVAAFDMGRADVHDMIDLLAQAKRVEDTYKAEGVPAPEAFADGIVKLQVEIAQHKKDAIEKRKKELRAQRTNLLSAQEKRDAIDRELADLEGKTEPVPA